MFEVTPQGNAVPGFLQLTTDEGRKAAQLVGPVAPDWFDASLLRAVALLGGFDVEQVLDDAGVAPDRRDPPFGIGTPEPPVRRDDRLLLWLAVALALLLGLLLGVLVARRGRSS